MSDIEKTGVRLNPDGPLPVIHLKISSLVEAGYRLILRTPPNHPLGQIGESIAEGDLGDDPIKFPDDHAVNFKDHGPLNKGSDLNGCTLSVLLAFAAPSDNSTQSINFSAAITQDGNAVPNGTAELADKFSDLGTVIIRFRLVA